jgi:predicted RNase H-like nuclease (RuvC/YqgF family)
MDIKGIIRDLKNVEETHKNDTPFTFSLNVSSMARDCRVMIEELEQKLDNKDKQIAELKKKLEYYEDDEDCDE